MHHQYQTNRQIKQENSKSRGKRERAEIETEHIRVFAVMPSVCPLTEPPFSFPIFLLLCRILFHETLTHMAINHTHTRHCLSAAARP